MVKDPKQFSVVNWISTIVALLLGLLSLIGWVKESGKNEEILQSISSQTQKQWDLRAIDQNKISNLEKDVVRLQEGNNLRAIDQNKISNLEKDVVRLQEGNDWLKRSHRVCDIP